MRNFEQIGFTATHGCENANKGPFFFWKSGGCDNALTINSWWHQNLLCNTKLYLFSASRKQQMQDSWKFTQASALMLKT